MLLHSLLASSVERWPDAVAIDVPPGPGRSSRQRLSYAELDARAWALAAVVRPFVRGECVVGILLGRSLPDIYAAQIAVLRAGAAFVCIDPTHPREHAAFVLHDARAVVLLTDRDGVVHGGLGIDAGRIVDVATVPAIAPGARHTNVPPWLGDDSLAYAIYTSGTTGRPKGVLLQHGGIASLVASGVTRFALGPGDRIAQGSSHAYDSSVEETWLALASGATVVPVDDETIRRGPDLVPWLREEGITVLCPPPTLLRAMHCEHPARDLPRLRLCYAGGEAMPQDLCDVWARDLWLENGYGPTECSVTVVRGRLQPGKPVTIGTPVPGHRAALLDGNLLEVTDGETGELCIAGPGLARGYLGHDDLTCERFVVHPQLGRVYRTGDLAVRGPDGTLQCLGRIDSQVKVRGHRIELEAIEAMLVRCDGVREAACRVQGDGSEAVLVAYVVPVVAASPPTFAVVRDELRRHLPPAMVPSALVVLDALPRTIGGKLDRRSLPAAVLAEERPRGDPPSGVGEELVAAAFAARLPGKVAVGRDDDFFACGGDSLRAAQVITDLRRSAVTAHLTVRDLYRAPTVRGLAAIAAAGTPPPMTQQAAVDPLVGAHPWLVTVAQVACLAVGLFLAGHAAVLGVFDGAPWLVERFGFVPFVLCGPLLAHLGLLLWAPVALWFAVLVKETLIGVYTPLSAPVWSGFFLRNWIVQRCVQLVPWRELQGTEFLNIGLRALGAKIGRRVHVHRGVDLLAGGWDLLELGDDVTIGQEASLGLVDLDGGRIVIGPVRIGSGALLDVRAGTGPDVEVGAGAVVLPLSALPAGSRVPAGEAWDGVPARTVGRAPAVPQVTIAGRELSPLAHGCLLLAMRVLAAPLALLPFTLAVVLLARHFGVDGALVLQWFAAPRLEAGFFATGLAALLVAVPSRLLVQALLLRFLPKAPIGTIRRWSPSYCVVWLRTDVLQSAGVWLSGTMLWPVWLRLAGMRIGPQCEISTIVDVLPEHVTIGGGSFFADGIYLASPRVRAGTVTMAATRLGAGVFLGNHVVVPAGQQLPDGLVLGVSTVADDRLMTADTGWFGQPPFRLPRREVVVVDRRLTHDPSLLRIAERLGWELLRFALPLVPVVLLALWCAIVAVGEQAGFAWLAGPAASFVVAVAAAVLVWTMKWVLLGRVRPGQHALWSSWASRWDFLYVAWGFVARGVFARFEGTLVLNAIARAMGARIGRRVVLGPGFAQIVDPDMLHLGDGATVAAMFQAHSFEDRVLKIDHVHVGAGATVAPGTVVLYGARIGERTTVGMHGVVMKHEHLLPDRHYEGAPTAPTLPAPRSPVVSPSAQPVGDAVRRVAALDAARGLAVIAMVATHLVPVPDADSALPGLVARLSGHVEAWCAATFVLLVGVGAALGASRADVVLRRALALVVMGVLFGWSVWPTEILTALGLSLLAAHVLHRRGPGVRWCVFAALVALTPIAATLWGDLVEGDWLEEGSVPAVWTSFGLVTLRYAVFDGNYPLLPWVCLPLLGVGLAAGLHDPGRLRRWTWLAVQAAVLLSLFEVWRAGAADELGAFAVLAASEWGPPTTVPFVLLHGALAVASLALLGWWHARRGALSPSVSASTSMLQVLGRSSLTHYVLHVLLVVVPLRVWYPDEDWPWWLGVAGALGYALCAVPATRVWLRRWPRAPFEALLARCAGRGR